MKKSLIFLLSFSFLSLGGCSFFKGKSTPPNAPVSYVYSAQVFQRPLLRRRGNLLVDPFLAGEDVYATDGLDRLALKLIQGLAEELGKSSATFQVLTSDNADRADLIMKGYFTRLLSPRRWMFGLFGNKKGVLAVSGEIVNSQNGELVAKFTHQREILQGSTGDLETVSLAIGKDIGKFLLSSLSQSSDSNFEGGNI